MRKNYLIQSNTITYSRILLSRKSINQYLISKQNADLIDVVNKQIIHEIFPFNFNSKPKNVKGFICILLLMMMTPSNKR